jgi:palmitoyl-protein thioesterase
MIRAIVFTIACFLTAIAGSIMHAEPLPVVLVHGIMAESSDMSTLKGYIEEALPGTYVHALSVGNGKHSSLHSMEWQGDTLALEIMKDPKLANGFHMIAHSQGTLVARYYIENYNNPQVKTFISLAGPARGVFGTPGTYDNTFRILNHWENLARYLLYWSFIQHHVGFAGYWNDSAHHDKYLKKCLFLPILNNEVDHPLASFYKNNICKLENFVLVASAADVVIEPLESCHFGFYKNGSKELVESVYEWDIYKEDKLGLKALDDSGRLHLLWDSSSHCDMPESKECFERIILPFLKGKQPKSLHYSLEENYQYDYEF